MSQDGPSSAAQLWHSEAVKRFPDLKEELAAAESPYEFWTDLLLEFENAYDSDKRDRIAAIYDYARWCLAQPRSATAQDDLPTCVSVCFVEHIPDHPKALQDMPRWWSIGEVRKIEALLRYHAGAEGYARILEQFGVK